MLPLLVNSILEQWMTDNVTTIVFIIIFLVMILGSTIALIVNKIISKNKKRKTITQNTDSK